METNHKIKLIAFDLDGTLLKDNKKLTPRTVSALKRASEAGIQMVPTTGRLYDLLPEKLRSLPFIHYVIGVNGAELYDAWEKQILHQADLSIGEAARVFAYVRGVSAIVGGYQERKGFMSRKDVEQMERFAQGPELLRLMRSIYTPVEDLEAHFLQSGNTIQKLILFFSDLEERKRVYADMQERFADMAVSSAVANNIEVNAKAANKGAALKSLRERLGLRREEVMAFGDGSNDVTMLLEAGRGIAMGNACEEAKEAADEVTLTNEEEGVAFEIEKLLKQQERKK